MTNYSKLFYDYMTYDVTNDEKCSQCKVLPLCMGGCPFNRLHNYERCKKEKYIIDNQILNIYGNEYEIL